MEDASPATFRPTWHQALGRGLYLGSLTVVGVLLITSMLLLTGFVEPPPGHVWAALILVPSLGGALVGMLVGRVTGTQISSRGIRTRSVFTPWHQVVDLRAERRGARTVVSVYLDSGASVQLQAPYSGGFFAADPRFEGKMFALSAHVRSHRFGGLPG
ncbi:hypothetical protein KOI35_02690 [Actinoplanes bogorensis]|uniref:PH domain-containing protein n=1 Tax=Paractinoplanes bogorensis TaxID=1610840 RepID=A0ABS5YGB7_9ACTN|nr:hypothetical protein [Actinoplanes bogorensis]MBU2662410.1 hypothetical protein [Actinoplanes bogorensis]